MSKITRTLAAFAAASIVGTMLAAPAQADEPGGGDYAECQPGITDKCPSPVPESCEDRLDGFRQALLDEREVGHTLRAQLAAADDRVDTVRGQLTTARDRLGRKSARIVALRERIERLRAR